MLDSGSYSNCSHEPDFPNDSRDAFIGRACLLLVCIVGKSFAGRSIVNCHIHHRYHVSQCQECADAKHVAYWAAVNAEDDFNPVDHAKVLITVGAVITIIAAVSLVLIG